MSGKKHYAGTRGIRKSGDSVLAQAPFEHFQSVQLPFPPSSNAFGFFYTLDAQRKIYSMKP